MTIRMMVILTVLVLSGLCRGAEGAKPAEAGIAIEAKAFDNNRTEKTDFEVFEPIWVRITIKNNSEHDQTVFVRRQRDNCISLKLRGKTDIAIELPRSDSPANDFTRDRHNMKPGGEVTYEVLLPEYLRVAKVGKLELDCSMYIEIPVVKEGERKGALGMGVTLRTTLSVIFSRMMDKESLTKLEDMIRNSLQDQTSSTEVHNKRVLAIRLCRCVPTSDLMPFLDKGVHDDDVVVQCEAVRILSSTEGPEAVRLLEEAARSDKEEVSERAKFALTRRK